MWYYSRTEPWFQSQAAFLSYRARNPEACDFDVYAFSLGGGPACPIKLVFINLMYATCTRRTEATWYAALRVCATPGKCGWPGSWSVQAHARFLLRIVLSECYVQTQEHTPAQGSANARDLPARDFTLAIVPPTHWLHTSTTATAQCRSPALTDSPLGEQWLRVEGTVGQGWVRVPRWSYK